MSDDAGTIVVGGGHAGVEAALASARLGVPTLLVTGDPAKICTLPCNPSIGGSAKGQLVREIDALGGAMGVIADRCSLHARFLNESKGPAVRALRQQMDKPAYAREALAMLRAQPNLTIVQGFVEDLIAESGAIRGVRCADGTVFNARRVVLATGTFLGGKSFQGEVVRAEGRFGEAPAIGLAAALRRLGFPTARLKTGTPPRIDRTSVDYRRHEGAAAEYAAAALLLLEPRAIRRTAAALLSHRNDRGDPRAGARESSSLAALRTRFDSGNRSALLSVDRR